MGRPRPVMVVLVVSTFVEAVGDASLLALRAVVVAWAAVPMTARAGVLLVMSTVLVRWWQ